MASKRAVRRRECQGKRAHVSREDALAAIRGTIRNSGAWGRELSPYHCPHCGKWHLGHPRGYYRDNINKRAMRGEM